MNWYIESDNPFVVSVHGISGGGKTTVAKLLLLVR